MNTKCQITEFSKTFNTEEKCLQHLCTLKWGNGFICPKCNHNIAVKGRSWYYRRCQKCKHDDSCFANTLFHKLKIPVVKAFLMVYQLSTLKKGMSCAEISRQFNVHIKTAWFFRSKIQKSMNEENFMGFKSFLRKEKKLNNKKTSLGQQNQVVIKVNFSTNNSIKAQISSIQTNFRYSEKQKWSRILWVPGKAAGSNSERKKNRIFVKVEIVQSELNPLTGLYVFNLKNWLAGVHHGVSVAHLQRYLNEFQYKYDNRKSHRGSPLKILAKVVELPWLPYKKAKAN